MLKADKLNCPSQKNQIQKEINRKFFGQSENKRINKIRRNPIIPEKNNIYTPQWKPSVKKLVIWNKTTFNKPSKDEVIQYKNRGLFNDYQRDLKDDLNLKRGLRRTNYYYQKPKIDVFADIYRGTKRINYKNSNRNPWLEAAEDLKIIKKKNEFQISEDYKKKNYNKHFLKENPKKRLETELYLKRSESNNLHISQKKYFNSKDKNSDLFNNLNYPKNNLHVSNKPNNISKIKIQNFIHNSNTINNQNYYNRKTSNFNYNSNFVNNLRG